MTKKIKRIKKERYGSNDFYTLLTPDVLNDLGFEDRKTAKVFKLFENMNYFVKNGICLFYNTTKVDYQQSFLIGHAEQRQGEYIATAFRWIDSEEELTQIYEAITKKKITDSI